jgi:class 3 adenylate cyclase
MTAAVAAHLGRPARSLGAHRMRGLEEPVEVFALEAPGAARPA